MKFNINSNSDSVVSTQNTRPLPSPKNLTLKVRPSAKMSVICIRIRNHFLSEGFALNLVLKQRLGGTRNGLLHEFITALYNTQYSQSALFKTN